VGTPGRLVGASGVRARPRRATEFRLAWTLGWHCASGTEATSLVTAGLDAAATALRGLCLLP